MVVGTLKISLDQLKKIMSCCFVLFISFFFVFYGLSRDCFLSLYVHYLYNKFLIDCLLI